MPATLEQLFAGDFAIAELWLAALNAAGLSAFAEFADADKGSPFVEVQFEQVQPTTARVTIAGRIYEHAWTGTLVSRVCTVRGKNSDRQKPMVLGIRAAARAWRETFNVNALPFHGLELFRESAVIRSIDEETRLDKTEVRHNIHFGIRNAGVSIAAAV